MANLRLSDEVWWRPERDDRPGRRRMRVEPTRQPSSPEADGRLGSSCTIPYGIPIIGWMHEIFGALDRTHARSTITAAFFTRPRTRILFVAGGRDA